MTSESDIKCVTLKNDIQAKLLQATQGLSPGEINKRRREKLQDPSRPLAQWWQRLTSREPVNS